MANVLEVLTYASERAANVARSCCDGSANESLLVAEKCEGEANTRFERDFKTIADVLAQESAKSEIASCLPELANHVRGEECSEIGGVRIALQETAEKTAELLGYLVPPAAAKRMSNAVHDDVNITLDIPKDLPDLNTDDLGVWIDPIDATAEFIAGVRGETAADGDAGLPCVTVLIGAYRRSTGEPVVGVINQPFYNNRKGRIIWGVCYGDTKKWGGSNIRVTDSNTLLMSSAEKPDIANKFETSGWDVQFLPGAGYKLLKVVLGEAAAYIVSKGTTFRWDTCAPHAILRAKGGEVLCYTTRKPITYNDPQNDDTQQYANTGGIVAYSNPTVLDNINSLLY